MPPFLLNINAYFIAYKAEQSYATTLFWAPCTSTHFSLIGNAEEKLLLQGKGRQREGKEQNRVWAFNMFRTFLHYVASWSDKQTDNWHPQSPQNRTKQPQDAGKTLSLHGRHFVACQCGPFASPSAACCCCCCCCQLCKRKMTNELVIDNNRKQKVSVAAKFPLTIAKKQWKSRGRGSRRSRKGGWLRGGARGGKSKSIWRCDVVEVVDRCACSTCANDAGCVRVCCLRVCKSYVCVQRVCVVWQRRVLSCHRYAKSLTLSSINSKLWLMKWLQSG